MENWRVARSPDTSADVPSPPSLQQLGEQVAAYDDRAVHTVWVFRYCSIVDEEGAGHAQSFSA